VASWALLRLQEMMIPASCVVSTWYGGPFQTPGRPRGGLHRYRYVFLTLVDATKPVYASTASVSAREKDPKSMIRSVNLMAFGIHLSGAIVGNCLVSKSSGLKPNID
jgi:hypothetical protein